MNEIVKTGIVVGVAAVVAGAAWVMRPISIRTEVIGEGEELFPEFEDSTSAATLEIVRYDKGKGLINELKIARKEGVWSIASRNDYPADADDAAERIQQAAVDLMDLKVINFASNLAADHVMFGVVEPDKEKVRGKEDGVGMRITMEDSSGNKLVDLIVGSAVKDSEGQCFVRKPGQSHVYTVAIDPNQLSSNFGDWIKGDLLGIQPTDVTQFVVQDYSSRFREDPETGQRRLVQTPRCEATVEFEARKFEWKLRSLREPDGNKLVDASIEIDEQVDSHRFMQLREFASQISIVDAIRKPATLAKELIAGAVEPRNAETFQSLGIHGFMPIETESKQVEIVAAEGELHLGLRKGVDVALKFGTTRGIDESGEEPQIERYLMISTEFKPSLIPQLDLRPVPESSDDPLFKDRDNIEKDNERKQSVYDRDVAAGRKLANELNQRFANWYYVITEDVYRQLHLSRFDIITERTDAEGFQLDDFRELERGISAKATGQAVSRDPHGP